MSEQEEFEFRLRLERERQTPVVGDAAPDPIEGMSGFQKFAAGMGQGAARMGRAVRQGVGLMSDDEIAEANRLDAPLMATGSGKAGSIAGSVAALAPAMLIPGVNTYAGATALGATTGLATTEGDLKERAKGAAWGAAGGAVGKFAGDKLGAWLSAKSGASQAQAAANQSQNAVKDATLATGRSRGYVVPPSQVDGSAVIPRVLEGLGGKIKTEQAASVANQQVTNKLARAALGMRNDAPLTVDALDAIRQQAGQAYAAVRSTGQVNTNPAYVQALDDAIAPFVSKAQSFPNGKVPPVVNEIEALKTGAFDAGDAIEAIKVLRNDAGTAYRAGDNLTGKAYKKAAEAMEQAIDDHLVATGAPANLLRGYRDARTLIAKTYTVQNALKEGSGNVLGSKLAAALDKGKPLTGQLRDAASFAQAYPKATQNINGVAPFSVLDMFAGGFGVGTNPLLTAGVLARPAARAAILNPTVQRMAVHPSYRGNKLLELLSQGANTAPANMMLRTAPLGLVPANQ